MARFQTSGRSQSWSHSFFNVSLNRLIYNPLDTAGYLSPSDLWLILG